MVNYLSCLKSIPEPAKTSWFTFDHFYSDTAFHAALKTVFSIKPKVIYDIGDNTEKWALRCCQYDSKVSVTILDLPQHIKLAKENVRNPGMADRIFGYPVDMLSDNNLPTEP
ncbi:hypothetical protein IQ211_09765 [Xenorhabdus griffiniae]|nr:hypothetical protein [Xenorhabdus griffiniae]MBE8587647.1 hypothetical protein [Xenorhabdus griffiniae]